MNSKIEAQLDLLDHIHWEMRFSAKLFLDQLLPRINEGLAADLT